MKATRWSVPILLFVLVALVAWRAFGPRPDAAEVSARAGTDVDWEAPHFEFLDQRESRVSNESLRGTVWIADFFFSRCTSICPGLTARFVLLQSELRDVPVRFVSFSVDPEHDSPAVLAEYARQWNASETRWHLLSTTPDGLARTAEGLHVAVQPTGNADDPILHTNRFVLFDANGRVRGYYDSDDETAVQQLARDARRLVSGDAQSTASPLSGRDGKTLFGALGCAACHSDARLAPALGGLRGREVKLDGGAVVVADAAYIEESIVDPWAKLVAGYGPTMPNYRTLLDPSALAALVEYVGSAELVAPAEASAAVERVVDPVCEMKVTVTAKTPSAEFAGRTYWFCCEPCRKRFVAAPASFVAALPVPETHAPAPSSSSASVAFVLGSDAEVLDFTGPMEVFAAAYTKEWKPLFAPYTVAASREPLRIGGGLTVVADHTFQSAPPPKVVVIPAMSEQAVTPEMLAWIRKAAQTADVTLSVCNGAFVLARTGLLDGRRATAHHGAYFRFAATFPHVQLQRGARFVEDGKFATAGGVSSGIDLALRIVQRYLGYAAAADVASGIEYQGRGWLDPDSNTAFTTLPVFDDEHPLCPLCLMDGDRSISATHEGKTYSFCAESEREFFELHHDVFARFLKEDAEVRSTAVPANSRPTGTSLQAWPEDRPRMRDLEQNGDCLNAAEAVVWLPRGALSEEERRTLLDALTRGVQAAKKHIGRERWTFGGDPRVYFYFPDAQFIAHAPGGNTVFIPLWRQRDGQSPWMHETLHLLLASSRGEWLVQPVEQQNEGMPLWLHEGLAESLAIDIDASVGLRHYSPLIDVPPEELPALCRERLESTDAQRVLSFVGARGKLPELFTEERMKYAPAFYAASTSFTRFLVERFGMRPLVESMEMYPDENAELEKRLGTPLAQLKSEWLDSIALQRDK